MAGEGAGGAGLVPLIGTLVKGIKSAGELGKQGRKQAAAESAAISAAIVAQNAARTAANLSLSPRPDVVGTRAGSLSPAAVYRAAAPGTPPGTGSGVPPPPPVPPEQRLLELAIAIVELIRQLKARAAPSFSFPSFSFGGVPDVYLMAPTSQTGALGGGGDFLSNLPGVLAGVGSIISSIRGPQAMPGGFSFVPTQQGTFGSGVANVVNAFTGGGGCPTAPFAPGGSAVRAQHFVVAHPVTGRAVWFKPAGRPILWSGDLSACRRVRKIAGRARRRLGGR